MRKLIKRNVSFLVPMLGLLMISCSNDNFSVTRSPVFSAMQLPGSSEAAVEEHIPGHHAELPAEAGTHGDHDPKHGGTFFMALDNEHHLEGILLSPGIFGVYLYDAYTQPLGRAELHQASGTVQWGDFDGARETPLAVNDVEQRLEAEFGQEVQFPVTLTLLLRLPGMAPDVRPELFTFPFSDYSEQQQYDWRYLVFMTAALGLLFLLVRPLERYKKYRKFQANSSAPVAKT